MSGSVELGWQGLALASIGVIALAGVNLALSMGQARALLFAALRATLQLLMIGFVLESLFAASGWGWVLGMAVVMVLAAGREVVARQQRTLAGWWGYGVGVLSMFVCAFVTVGLALAVVLSPEPWYAPRYAIPLLGMVLGNTMTGIALGLDRLTQSAWRERASIEGRLALGKPWPEAIGDLRREAARSALTPILHAMAAAGIVSLPGMMTGQILAGAPPLEAVQYQILILFLIATGTGLGSLAAIALACRRLFDGRHRLRLDRLRGAATR